MKIFDLLVDGAFVLGVARFVPLDVRPIHIVHAVRHRAKLDQVANAAAQDPIVAERTRHRVHPDLEPVRLAHIFEAPPWISLTKTEEGH